MSDSGSDMPPLREEWADVIEVSLDQLASEVRRLAWMLVRDVIEKERARRHAVVEAVGAELARTLEAALALARPVASKPAAISETSRAQLAAPERVTPPEPPLARLTDSARDGDSDADEVRTDGVVKWFDDGKGFGFIVGAHGEDVFVHYKHIAASGFRALREGQRVRYIEHVGDRGRFATHVRPIGP